MLIHVDKLPVIQILMQEEKLFHESTAVIVIGSIL